MQDVAPALALASNFASADTNNDGQLSATEMVAAADKDGDGVVSVTEMGKFAAAMTGNAPSKMALLKRKLKAASDVYRFQDEIRKQIKGVSPLVGLDPDIDGDGNVSEFERFVWEQLQKVDTDGDGTLSSKEVYAVVAQCCQEKMAKESAQKTSKRLGKLLTLAIVVVLALMGMLAGMIVIVNIAMKDQYVEEGKLTDSSGNVMAVSDSRVQVELIVAPVLPLEQLAQVKNLQVTFSDPAEELVQTKFMYTVAQTKKVNSTAVTFVTTVGDELKVWNGETYVLLGGDPTQKYTVCKADVACSALTVNDLEAADKLLEQAHSELVGAGFEATRLRSLAVCEACVAAGYGGYSGYSGKRRSLDHCPFHMSYGYGYYDRRQLSAPPALAMQRPRRSMLATAIATSGEPTVDLVVARYDEDLHWLLEVERELPLVRIFVFDKQGDGCAPLSTAVCLKVKNVGLEAQAYLEHIVTNYDNLADKTIFSQGSKPTPGFFSGRSSSGHMMPLDDFFYDYLRPSAPARYVVNVVRNVHSDQTPSHLIYRKALLDPEHGGAESLDAARSGVSGPAAACSADAGLWTDVPGDDFDKYVLNPRLEEQPTKPKTFEEFYQAFVGSAAPNPAAFNQGAIFSVTRAMIQSTPRSVYAGILNAMDAQDDVLAYYLEQAWGYLFNAIPSDQCYPSSAMF